MRLFIAFLFLSNIAIANCGSTYGGPDDYGDVTIGLYGNDGTESFAVYNEWYGGISYYETVGYESSGQPILQSISPSTFRARLDACSQPWTADEECNNWYRSYESWNDCPWCTSQEMDDYVCDNCPGQCGGDCPPVNLNQVGQSCPCDQGGYGGTWNYDYDANNCPYLYCDGCMDCPLPPGNVGDPCQDPDPLNDPPRNCFIAQGDNDANGCPTYFCDCEEPPDSENGCYGDADGNGTPNYLEPEHPQYVGEPEDCTCDRNESTEPSTEVLVNPRDDDPQSTDCPYYECDCADDPCSDRGGDADSDGCCADDDPDDNDPEESDCDGCYEDIETKIDGLIQIWGDWVGLPDVSEGVYFDDYESLGYQVDFDNATGLDGFQLQIDYSLNNNSFFGRDVHPFMAEMISHVELVRVPMRLFLVAYVWLSVPPYVIRMFSRG